MKVMLVDDDVRVLEDLSTALEPTGYECVKFDNPVQALEAYDPKTVDVVISDIRMPQMTGIELLEKIRMKNKNAKVIIITAYGDLQTAQAAINHRAFAFFGKPIDIGELIETLSEIEDSLKGENHLDMEQLQESYQELKQAYDHLLELVKQTEVKDDLERE